LIQETAYGLEIVTYHIIKNWPIVIGASPHTVVFSRCPFVRSHKFVPPGPCRKGAVSV